MLKSVVKNVAIVLIPVVVPAVVIGGFIAVDEFKAKFITKTTAKPAKN